MGFIDTVMVGRLGPEELAAVALGNSVFFTLLIISTGVIQAVGPMVAQAEGADDPEPVERSVRQGLWLSVLLAAPACVLLWTAGTWLPWANQEPATVARTTSYLRVVLWGFLPACGFMALRSFVEGLARPLPVTVIAFVGVLLNVAANYVLMYGAWGFPALGIVGTALASTLVFWTVFLLLAGLVAATEPFREYRVFTKLRTPDPTYLRELFRIGGPMGVSRGVEAGMFMITALMVGTLGARALAAHQIALQCAAFTFMVPVGVAIAGAVRVGQAAGRDDPAGARIAGLASIVLATGFMTVAALLFWTIPRPIVALYLDVSAAANADVVEMAVALLGIAAVFQVADGIQVAASGALQGVKDTRVPMLIALSTYWGIGLTSGYVLGLRWGWGAPGLWWGLVLGLIAAAVVLSLRFHLSIERAAASTSVRPDAPMSSIPGPASGA
jgi:MATE family multidrug resistance protein